MPYGPLNTVIGYFPNIYRDFFAFIAAFHKTIRTKFSYEAHFAYLHLICTTVLRILFVLQALLSLDPCKFQQ